MEHTLSPTQALVAIFSEPRKVFDAIPRRTMAWWPIAIALIGYTAIWLWYYQAVDFGWLQDRLIEERADVTDATSRQVAAAVLTRTSLMVLSVAGSLIVIPTLLALLAAYFLVAGKLLGHGRPYKQWLGFVAWATAPMLLLLPVMALQILLSQNGQLSPEALNPVSLNQLVFHFDGRSPWHGLLDSLSLTTLWCVGLLAFGLHRWTGRAWSPAIAVAVLPFAAIYAGWAVKIAVGA